MTFVTCSSRHGTTKSICEEIRKDLWDLSDEKYKNLHAGIIPTIPEEQIIGVRIPKLRKLAKSYAQHPQIEKFLDDLPHTYYDENNLHAYIVEQISDYDMCMQRVEQFLPYVDNWATCDTMKPKVFERNKTRLLAKIDEWLASGQVYTIRFGVNMLMRYYLDEDFSEEFLNKVALVRSDEYYVKMVVAWYFATALAKQYEAALPYLTDHRLDTWTHNKTIQKARESYRITSEQKVYLATLRRKDG